LTSFSSLSLADEIHRAIRDSGYTNPTPIQAQMIPLIQEGHDVIGLSQTGTGKTAAFVLPILHQLATSKTRARRGSCSVLILSPTRELTNQIADTVRRYGKYINYAQAIIVGGVSYPPQIKALRRGVDIVIATPGRALDHIESGELGLDETTTIILDEADQMLDFGFLPVIKKIIERLPEQRQAVLLSATMPKAVKGLAESLMTEPKLVEATPESKPVDRVSQQVIMVEKKPQKHGAS
jgi:ATP-dependent RNA helicase RhlE